MKALFRSKLRACLLSHPLKLNLPNPQRKLWLKPTCSADELERIGDDLPRLKPSSLLYRKPPIPHPYIIMQLLRNIRIYPSEVISQRHTDITANAFSTCQLPFKIRNPAKQIIPNFRGLIAVKLTNCFGVNPNFSLTNVRADEVGVVVGGAITSRGLCGFRE